VRIHLSGLWRHPDFVRLWAAETVSIFGSLVTRTALPFVAILVLDAGSFEVAVLGLAGLAPAFLFGLVAGAWVDRLPRRPIMIAADLGRAAVLLTIPIAALTDSLRIEHLYLTQIMVSILSVFFDVAYQSYLPSLISREELVEGNSKLTASASVAEFAAFGSGGWLVQWLTAPYAIVVDAVTFLWSAWFVFRIRAPEPPPPPKDERQEVLVEIKEGIHFVRTHAALRALSAANLIMSCGNQMISTVFLLFVTRDLGLHPGLQGLIYSIGGVASFGGAYLAERVSTWLGIHRTIIWTIAVVAFGQLLVGLADGALVIVLILLIAQQFITDPAWTILDITQVSYRQSITPDRWLGRTNASLRVVDFGGMVAGALLGGWLGSWIGLRATMLTGVGLGFLAALYLAAAFRSRIHDNIGGGTLESIVERVAEGS
jgi:Na+/melibiose symporter-like transporter